MRQQLFPVASLQCTSTTFLLVKVWNDREETHTKKALHLTMNSAAQCIPKGSLSLIPPRMLTTCENHRMTNQFKMARTISPALLTGACTAGQPKCEYNYHTSTLFEHRGWRQRLQPLLSAPEHRV